MNRSRDLPACIAGPPKPECRGQKLVPRSPSPQVRLHGVTTHRNTAWTENTAQTSHLTSCNAVIFWTATPNILSGGRGRSRPTQAYRLQLQGRNWTPRLILYNFRFIYGLKCSPGYLLWFTAVFLSRSMQITGHDNFLADILSPLTHHSALCSQYQRHYIRSGRKCNMGIWTMYSVASSYSWPRRYKDRSGAFFPNLDGRLPKTPYYKFLPSWKLHMFVVNPFNIELNLNYSQFVPRSKHTLCPLQKAGS